jgi:hypothetical protein
MAVRSIQATGDVSPPAAFVIDCRAVVLGGNLDRVNSIGVVGGRCRRKAKRKFDTLNFDI